jgi:hypothetical protein
MQPLVDRHELAGAVMLVADNPTRRFITIFLVQYAGPPADRANFLAPFRKAAAERCAGKHGKL